MINRPLLKKSRRPALVSSLSHVHVANVADIAQCAGPEAAAEAKIENSASEPVGAEKSETASGDVAANVDEANKESPTAEGDTKVPPAEAHTTPDSSESAPKATEEEAISENSSPNEDKKPKEAEFPPIDPAAGNDVLAAEGAATGATVSKRIECYRPKSKLIT